MGSCGTSFYVAAAMLLMFSALWVNTGAFVVRPAGDFDRLQKRNSDANYRLNNMQQRAWAAKADPMYIIGKRSGGGQRTCWSDLECSVNECCALPLAALEKPSRVWGPTNQEEPTCKPLGRNGDPCFAVQPSSIEVGCGCREGLRCVTFAGINFGVCAEMGIE